MRNLARRDSASEEVIQAAILLGDPWTLDSWLRSNWTVIPDPMDAELIRSPALMIGCLQFSGDCDDAATLAGSILHAMHVPAYFVATRQPTESDFSHVFVKIPVLHLDIDPIVPANRLPITYAEAMTLEV